MKKYKWIASSDDGNFEDESRQEFTSFKECYDDMRNAALGKMKWNTELCDFYDIPDGGYIGYEVRFSIDKIVHESYSGVYTYEIKEVYDKKNVELTESQISTIKASIRVAIEETPFRFERLLGEFKIYDKNTIDRLKKSSEDENELRKEILRLLETI